MYECIYLADTVWRVSSFFINKLPFAGSLPKHTNVYDYGFNTSQVCWTRSLSDKNCSPIRTKIVTFKNWWNFCDILIKIVLFYCFNNKRLFNFYENYGVECTVHIILNQILFNFQNIFYRLKILEDSFFSTVHTTGQGFFYFSQNPTCLCWNLCRISFADVNHFWFLFLHKELRFKAFLQNQFWNHINSAASLWEKTSENQRIGDGDLE